MPITSSASGIEIGRRALQAQQTAIQVTSHNIANINTPGFSRRRTEIVAANSGRGSEGVGSGADVEAVVRQSSRFLNAQFLAEQSETTFSGIFGAGVQDGDSIRIQGTTHSGVAVTRSFLIDDATTKTIGDLLTEIRSSFGGDVSASLDSEGRILITDNQVGPSSLTVALVEEHEGGGSLDFGSIEVEEEGRFPMGISAVNRDGKLSLEHESFGSRHGFTATESLSQLGLSSGEITGADVEGTINGEAATGLGRVLTGARDNENTDGLALRITATPEQLAATGSDLGSVEVIFGIGRLLNDQLGFITDKTSGSIQNRQNAIDETIDNLDDQIEAMERRAAQVQQGLVRKFASLEGSMAALQSQGNFLSTQLASLAGNG